MRNKKEKIESLSGSGGLNFRKFSYLLIGIFCVACTQYSDSDVKARASSVSRDTDLATSHVEPLRERSTLPNMAPTMGSWVTQMNREPTAIHMTWSQPDAADGMTFSWSTRNADDDNYTPRVWVVPKDLTVLDGDTIQMPLSPEFVHDGYGIVYKENLLGVDFGLKRYVVWHVEVDGLEPDTEYVYRVGTWADFDGTHLIAPDLSLAMSFRTAPQKGVRQPLKFILAGDSRGGTWEIHKHIGKMNEHKVLAWFFNGDMTQAGTQSEWGQWWDAMSPVTTRGSLMPVQGNHEVFANVFYEQFVLPRHSELPWEWQEHGWAVDVGNVHFVGLDSNSDYSVEALVGWLREDLLKARNDPDIDWIVAMMHHPAWSSSKHGSTDRVRHHWVPLFDEAMVDVVFAGHDHNFERTKPLRGFDIVDSDQGTIYVVAGAFFSPPYQNGRSWFTDVSFSGEGGSYVVMTTTESTLEILTYSGNSETVLDRYEIRKKNIPRTTY